MIKIISVAAHIPFPRPLVYTTYRDKLLELVPYLPNIQRIEVKTRQEENGIIHFLNEWYGGGEIPGLARSFFSESMLSWSDQATWNNLEFTANWCNQSHAFAEAVCCAGKHRFLEDNTGTRIESQGELMIDPKGIARVPQFLASQLAKTVEDFLSAQIGSNLLQLSDGVRHYLEKSLEKS